MGENNSAHTLEFDHMPLNFQLYILKVVVEGMPGKEVHIFKKNYTWKK